MRHSFRFHDKSLFTVVETQEKPVAVLHHAIPTTTAQIDRFPPEMLVAIFVHLSKPDLWGLKPSSFILDLVSVTHVCKFWRQVAIDTPDLWSEIHMTNLEAVDTFLERSRTTPLNVDLNSAYEDVLRSVGSHTHRLRHLSLSASRSRGYDPFATLTNPAPLLERLVISCLADLQPRVLFDDQVPRLRELKIFASSLWLKTRFANLTSLHLTLYDSTRTHSQFLPFLDMLRRCPTLEEMYIWWNLYDIVPPTTAQTPTVPLPRLRKLLLRSFCFQNAKYLLHSFDLMADGIAIHLSDMNLGAEDNNFISRIQTVFPNNDPRQPSLVSSTKLELSFHIKPPEIIIHAIGPHFSIRIDTSWNDYDYPNEMNFTPHDVFSSVKELWVRGSICLDPKFNNFQHFPALERLVLVGRGSARNIRQALSPSGSGILPSPLLSVIEYFGVDELEIGEVFLLVRNRYNAVHQLKKLRISSIFIPLPVGTCGRVQDVESLNIPSAYSMDLPEYCFSKGHKWWQSWKLGL